MTAVLGGGTGGMRMTQHKILEKAGTVCVWSPQCAFLHVYECTKLCVEI